VIVESIEKERAVTGIAIVAADAGETIKPVGALRTAEVPCGRRMVRSSIELPSNDKGGNRCTSSPSRSLWDVVYGRQQLSLFDAHYDERCFLPIHVYDTATSRPVAVLLHPGKTPSGIEIRGHLRRLVRRIGRDRGNRIRGRAGGCRRADA
jgi:hypothetical protein